MGLSACELLVSMSMSYPHVLPGPKPEARSLKPSFLTAF
jgi:hypothetical protein